MSSAGTLAKQLLDVMNSEYVDQSQLCQIIQEHLTTTYDQCTQEVLGFEHNSEQSSESIVISDVRHHRTTVDSGIGLPLDDGLISKTMEGPSTPFECSRKSYQVPRRVSQQEPQYQHRHHGNNISTAAKPDLHDLLSPFNSGRLEFDNFGALNHMSANFSEPWRNLSQEVQQFQCTQYILPLEQPYTPENQTLNGTDPSLQLDHDPNRVPSSLFTIPSNAGKTFQTDTNNGSYGYDQQEIQQRPQKQHLYTSVGSTAPTDGPGLFMGGVNSLHYLPLLRKGQ